MRVSKATIVAALAIASMTAGCTTYDRVTDPASGRKYYTDDVNLEWLSAFDGPFRDYNLNLDAGLRTAIFQGFFAEAKIEYRYDSIPARGAEKEDVRYLLGVGWSF